MYAIRSYYGQHFLPLGKDVGQVAVIGSHADVGVTTGGGSSGAPSWSRMRWIQSRRVARSGMFVRIARNNFV